MIRLSTVLAILLLAACSDKEAPIDTDVALDTADTGVTDTVTVPTVPTWQVTGQVGNVLAVHTLPTQGTAESYRVTAVFANLLQGFTTAAGCMVKDGVCVQALPVDDDTFVDTTIEFDTERKYTWNGFSVTVDVVEAPFFNDPDDGVQYYDFSLEGPPLELNPSVSFSGEWGSFLSTNTLVIPQGWF